MTGKKEGGRRPRKLQDRFDYGRNYEGLFCQNSPMQRHLLKWYHDRRKNEQSSHSTKSAKGSNFKVWVPIPFGDRFDGRLNPTLICRSRGRSRSRRRKRGSRCCQLRKRSAGVIGEGYSACRGGGAVVTGLAGVLMKHDQALLTRLTLLKAVLRQLGGLGLELNASP
jgi:hypothetical protein